MEIKPKRWMGWKLWITFFLTLIKTQGLWLGRGLEEHETALEAMLQGNTTEEYIEQS